MRTLPGLLVPVLLLGSCLGASPGEPAAPAGSGPLPASALDGAVRALETLAAVRPEGTLVRLGAIEGDTMVEPESGRELVRVFLNLTVYAPSLERSVEGFREVRAALEAEAAADARAGRVTADRVRRVFGELDWAPVGREDLESYSEVVRLEMHPGVPAPRAVLGDVEAAPRTTIEAYVRTTAVSVRLGQLDLTLRQAEGLERGHALRCSIADPTGRPYTRAQIGAFLGELEAGSPAARLTRLQVQRSSLAADPLAEEAWTFEAELAVGAEPAG